MSANVGEAAATLQGLSGRLVMTLNCIQEGVQIIAPDWRYLYVNDAVCRQGRKPREELLGRRMMDVYPGIEQTDMFAALSRCLREQAPQSLENHFRYPDGQRAWFELRAQPCAEGLFVMSVDITARKQIEQELRESQKLDAIGKLAGGVAHDFNNLLTGMSGFASFALEALPPQHAAADDLREVLAAAERAAALTQQLLAFARKQTIAPRVVDVNELVGSVDKLLRRLLRADIDIVTTRAADVWRTSIDPGAFEQVLINLAINARDAMPGGGRLTIETSNARLDEGYSLSRGGVIPAGDYVLLAVSDDGVGMDSVTQERIFEPFFTTKGVGQGTGLGLSTCYGIVRQAGGYIWVYSEVGHGTTFKIYLPRSHADADAVAPPQALRASTGSETVLVVEDDAQVRQVAVRSLERAGYAVVVAGGAEEALALCGARSGEIDLLLTDMVMPGVSGRDLAMRLGERYPRMRTLFVSGYTEGAILHRGLLARGAQVMDKPFTPRALAERVRAVLDGTAA